MEGRERPSSATPTKRQNSLLDLAGLCLFLAGSGAILHRLAGPPRAPAGAAPWTDAFVVLRGADLPPETLVYLLTLMTWGVWGWTVGSLLLRLGLRLADALAPDAVWLRWVRRVSDRLTLPAVRRIADGAVLATAALTLTVRPPVVDAIPLGRAVVAAASTSTATPSDLSQDAHPQPVVGQSAQEAPEETHTVRPGDTLWSISERVYGTGYEFMRLVSANTGRRMPDGATFTDAGLIRPGWVLRVPRQGVPAHLVEGRQVYVVQRDDTLQGIAVRFLGDAASWREVFELNRGVARLPDGRTLTHPDLIWPGLHLELPPVAAATALTGRPSGIGSEDATGAIEDVTAHAAPGEGVAEPAGPEPAGSPVEAAEADAPATPTAPPPAQEAHTPAVIDELASAGDVRSPTDGEVPVHPAARDLDADADMPAAGTPAGKPLESAGRPPRRSGWSPTRVEAETALAAGLTATVAGAVVLGARRAHRRRRLSDPPVPIEALTDTPGVVPLFGGFGDAPFDSGPLDRAGGGSTSSDRGEPAVVGADRVLACLADEGVQDTTVLTVCQERTPRGFSLQLLILAGAGEQERVLELSSALGTRLGRAGHAHWTVDHDVELHIDDVSPLYLIPGGPRAGAGRARGTPPMLLPIGAHSPRHTLYANWRELGHVLVAGSVEPATTVLTSLVASLAARRSPAELTIHCLDSSGSLPASLRDLPHQGAGASAVDAVALRAHAIGVLREVSHAAGQRARAGTAGGWMPPDGIPGDPGADAVPGRQVVVQTETVLVISELGDLLDTEDDTGREEVLDLLHSIGEAGPGSGIRILAACGRPEMLRDTLLGLFETRFVLAQPDEVQSVRLLGRPDAVALGGAGELFVRIGGRLPVHVRGLRVAPERLTQLVRRMREAHGEGLEAQPGSATAGDLPGSCGLPSAPDPDPLGTIPVPWSQALVAESRIAFHAPRSPAGEVACPSVSLASSALVDAASAATSHVADLFPAPPLSSPLPALTLPDVVPDPEGPVRPKAEGRSAHRDRGALQVPAGATEAVSQPAAAGPLVYVQCFGGLRVSSTRSGRVVGGADAGYQAWAILAFLAAQPDGAAPTEALCAAIWPDVDPGHAATARLSPALSRLRRVLQAEVAGLSSPIVIRGRNGFCSLDSRVVGSDAQQFLRLREVARRQPPDEAVPTYEALRTLYQGDLLARQTYEWVERRERDGLTPLERYQRLYHSATCELADLYRRRGETARAVPLYRELLAADPTAEDVARTLFRCYGELGDRPALLREYQRLRQLLRRALDHPDDEPDDSDDDDGAVYEPEAETVAVYEDILSALDGRSDQRPPAPGVSTDAAG